MKSTNLGKNRNVSKDANMFKQANGVRYVRFLLDILEKNVFDWYLEVGCRSGRIFGNSRGKTIAVDPYFQVQSNVINVKPELHVFQKTSDDFFASNFLDAIDAKLSFSFLDGMHLFEYLLRDFIATERNSTPDSVIALHDCCPFTYEMTTRDLDNLPDGNWTGDVWKIIPILKKYRPDLNVSVLDAAPTGLVLVSGLDPKSRILPDAYEDIVDEFTNLDLETFGLKKFGELFDYQSAKALMAEGHTFSDKITLPPDLVLTPNKITP